MGSPPDCQEFGAGVYCWVGFVLFNIIELCSQFFFDKYKESVNCNEMNGAADQ